MFFGRCHGTRVVMAVADLQCCVTMIIIITFSKARNWYARLIFFRVLATITGRHGDQCDLMIVVGHPIGMGRSLAYFFPNAWNHVTLPLERKKKGKGVCILLSSLEPTVARTYHFVATTCY
jgi:hypothetical protein